MIHKLFEDFKIISSAIINENKSELEWSKIESDDMFQTYNYIGGFDATEKEFCFSVYLDGKEYWFQLSLSMINSVATGNLDIVEIKFAE